MIRRAGALLLTAALLAASTAPSLADDDSQLRLPDRFYVPSPDLAGTDDTGPIGPLTAIMEADRTTSDGSSVGFVGISSSGTYAFLDLPDWEPPLYEEIPWASAMELSPDGRSIAYWYRGDTPGAPDPTDGTPVVGVAVYDTVTGDVERRPLPSRHGLQTTLLAWGGGAVWLSAAPYLPAPNTGASRGGGGTFIWRPGSDRLTRVADKDAGLLDYATGWAGGMMLPNDEGLREWTVDHPQDSQVRLRLTDVEDDLAVSPSGRWLALRIHHPVAEADSPLPGHLVLVDRPDAASGTGRVRDLPGDEHFDEVVAWRDEQRVIALRYETDDNRPRPGYYTVDVRTGHGERLFDAPWNRWEHYGTFSHIAEEAWAGPTYDAEPPSEPDEGTHLVAVALVPSVLVAAGGILWWRRRVASAGA